MSKLRKLQAGKGNKLLALLLLAAVFTAATAILPSAVLATSSGAQASDQVAKDSALDAKKDLQHGDPGFWSYALSTLLIRFVGIFVVLGILQVVMQISGRIFTRLEQQKK